MYFMLGLELTLLHTYTLCMVSLQRLRFSVTTDFCAPYKLLYYYYYYYYYVRLPFGACRSLRSIF